MLLLSQKALLQLAKGCLLMKRTEMMEMNPPVSENGGGALLFCYLCASHSRRFRLGEIVRQNRSKLNL